MDEEKRNLEILAMIDARQDKLSVYDSDIQYKRNHVDRVDDEIYNTESKIFAVEGKQHTLAEEILILKDKIECCEWDKKNLLQDIESIESDVLELDKEIIDLEEQLK